MKNLSPAELAAVAAVDRDRIADDLRALVATPSVTGDEHAAQTELALRMATAGLEVERVDADAAELTADPAYPGGEVEREVLPVVAARLGSGERRAFIAGHVDTVAAGDPSAWSAPPFSGDVRDGVLVGRGSLDMKGGLVAGLAALRALAETEAPLGGEALLLSVPSEEDGGAGMLAAIRAGYTADAAVITEPTALEVVRAQAGAITFRLTFEGRPAHAAFRRQGVSAIDLFRAVADALDEDEARRNEAERDPVMRDLGLPYPTSVGRVDGGSWSSTVPERLVAEGRYGVTIDQSVAEAEAELRAAVAAAAARHRWLREHPPAVEIVGGRFASAALEASHPLVWGVGAAARDVLGKLPRFLGIPYGSDARLLLHEGATPTVLYGPGDPYLAHAPDERVALDDVAACARVLAVWLLRELPA